MKWVSLKTIPPEGWSGVIRRVGWASGNARLFWGELRKEWMVEENDGYGGLNLYTNLDAFEWLDESEDIDQFASVVQFALKKCFGWDEHGVVVEKAEGKSRKDVTYEEFYKMYKNEMGTIK